MAAAEIDELEIPELYREKCPEVLPEAVQVTQVQYKSLLHLMYGTLSVGEYVTTNFLSLSAQELDGFQNVGPQFGQLKADPIDLYKIIATIEAGPPSSTRQSQAQLVEDLTDAEVNQALKDLYFTQEDQDGGENPILVVMKRWARRVLFSLRHLHEKVLLAHEFLVYFDFTVAKIQELKSMYNNLLSNLTSRNETNQLARETTAYKQHTVDLLDSYLKLYEEHDCVNTALYMENFGLVRSLIINGPDSLKAHVLNNYIWENFYYMPNCNIHGISEFEKMTDDIQKILVSVRGFAPLPEETTLSKANNLKLKAASARTTFNTVTAAEKPTLGPAKSLVKTLELLRKDLYDLELASSTANVLAAVGMSSAELEDLYAKAEDHLSQVSADKSLAEYKARKEQEEVARSAAASTQLAIVKLKGIESWLNFKRSYDDLIGYFHTDVTKKSAIMKALEVTEDKVSCQQMSTHVDIITWLESKYNDPAILVNLIENLLKMPRADSVEKSHAHLTKFNTLLLQLRHNKAENKIGLITMRKLIPILLIEDHKMDYFKKETDAEAQWKAELIAANEAAGNDDSVSLHLDNPSEEQLAKQRTFFIDQMTHYLNVIKKIKLVEMPKSKPTVESDRFGSRRKKNRNTTGALAGANKGVENYSCPICLYTHRGADDRVLVALGQCPKFKDMTSKLRLQLVEKYKHCKRCLRPKELSEHSHNFCKIGQDLNIVCKSHTPPSSSHHPMICIAKDNPGNMPRGGGQKPGKGGGRSGRGGKKNNTWNNNVMTHSQNGQGSQSGQLGGQHGGAQYSYVQHPGMSPTFSGWYQHPMPPGGHVMSPAPTSLPAIQYSPSTPIPQNSNSLTTSNLLQYQPSVTPPDRQGQVSVTVGSVAQNQAHFTTQNEHALPLTNAQILSKTTSHHMSFDPEKSRGLLSAVHTITAQAAPNSAKHILLALSDSGSGLGWVTFETVNKLGLEQVGTWSGEVATLSGRHQGTYPIFAIRVIDIFNDVHVLRLLGTNKLGFKDKLPSHIFEQICNDFRVSTTLVENCSGAVNILIGTDNVKLLSNPVLNKHGYAFPEVQLQQSVLTPFYFFLGAIGKRPGQVAHTMTFMAQHSSDIPNTSLLSKCWQRMRAIRNYINKKFVSYCNRNQTSELNSCIGSDPNYSYYQSSSQEHLGNDGGNGSEDQSCQSKGLVLGQGNFCTQALTRINSFACINPSCLIKNFSTYQAKKSVATINLESLNPVSDLACSDCMKKIAACQACRYINSNISVKEQAELELIRSNMKALENTDGSKTIFASYPMYVDPDIVFNAKHCQAEHSRLNSLRLRDKLSKVGLLEPFAKIMTETLEAGHAEEIPDDHGTPSNFVLLNFALKQSKSQPVRPVSNSSYRNKIGVSLNDNTVTGPACLGSGHESMVNFRLKEHGYCCDISRFYRNVHTCDTTNNLRKFHWFSDASDPSTLKCYRFLRGQYGDSIISIISELACRDYIATEAKTPQFKNALLNHRVCDDICSSCDTMEEVMMVKQDAMFCFNMFNFSLKHFCYSFMDCPDPNGDPIEDILGLSWNYQFDTLSTKQAFHAKEKRRGKYGPELSLDEVKNISITKTLLARLSGQSFEYLNILTGPVTSSLRIAFSIMCSYTVDWHLPLANFSESEDAQIREMLTSLVGLKDRVNSIPRCAIAAQHTLCRVIVSSDASKYGAGLAVHYVSINDQQSYDSRLVLTRSQVHKLTIPSAELSALVKGVKTAQQLLNEAPSLKTLSFTLIFVIDSLCSAAVLNPSKVHRDVRSRNAAIAIYKITAEILAECPGIKIEFTHCSSDRNASDIVSRFHLDPVTLCNAQLLREGPSDYVMKDFPKQENVFLTMASDQKPVYQAAVPQQSDTGAMCGSCHGDTGFCGQVPESERIVTTPSILKYYNLDCFSTDTTQFLTPLKYEIYEKLIINCSSLLKACRVIALILKNLISDYKDWMFESLVVRGWEILVRSHQIHFGVSSSVRQMRPTLDHLGISRVDTRLDSVGQGVLDMEHSPVLINTNDHRFVYLIVMNGHLHRSGVFTSVHLGPPTTQARIMTGSFPCYFPNMGKICRRIIDKCVTCSYVKKHPRQGEMGLPPFVKYLQSDKLIWAYTSSDMLGPYVRKTHPNSRSTTKYYILVIVDILIGSVSMQLMEGASSEDFHRAFYLHCTQYRTPIFHCSDQGSAANFKPDNPSFQKYFGKQVIETLSVQTGHQHLNRSERTICEVKKLLRTILLQRERVLLPQLTLTEVQALLNTICVILNNKPMSVNGLDLSLTPNHFLKPWRLTESRCGGADTPTQLSHHETYLTETLQNLELLSQMVGDAHSHFVQILKMIFVTNTSKYRQRGKSFDFKVGDLVIVFKTSDYYLGMVTEAGPQYCKVKSGYSVSPEIRTIHNQKLVLIHRDHPVDTAKYSVTQKCNNFCVLHPKGWILPKPIVEDEIYSRNVTQLYEIREDGKIHLF